MIWDKVCQNLSFLYKGVDMKVGVFAGTLVDTKMGKYILDDLGYETLFYPMAKNPYEQTKLQYYSKEKLEEIFISKALEGKSQGMEKVFIYCNSLSTVIDYEKISKKIDLDIITPLETYKNLDKDIKSLAIFAANGISAFNIDKLIRESREDISTITIGNLSVVASIEEEKSPQKIIEDLNIKGLLAYFENIRDERYRVDAILLGCTHFSYLRNHLKKLSKIKIIDPTEDMVRRLDK